MKLALFGKFLLHVLLPKTCFSCGADLKFASSEPLCPACEKELRTPGKLICRRCGVPLKDGGAHCYRCRGGKADEFKCKIIRSALLFNPACRSLVHAFKYSGYTHLARYMGRRMLLDFKTYPELADADVLVPVPLHAKKLRRRGYNQSELLARAFARETGLACDCSCLMRRRDTPSQTHLNRAGRLANMTGAFTCVLPECVKGKTVLLVDDVATTGATLEGCAQALKAAGARRVLAYTFSREP